MRPLAAQVAGNEPKPTQRLDCAGGFDAAYVCCFPTELIEYFTHSLFRRVVLPQMNIVALPPANCGSTIGALPTELKALTKRGIRTRFCVRPHSKVRPDLFGGYDSRLEKSDIVGTVLDLYLLDLIG